MGRSVEWFRDWRLLSWRSAAVAVVVLYTLVGFLVAPAVVKRVVTDLARDRLGREVTIERVKVNPYTLSLTVRGFDLPDRPGASLLSFDELYANAELSSLFRWALTLKELRVDNPYVGLRRFADGRVNVTELLEEIARRAGEESEAEPGPSEEVALPRVVCSTSGSTAPSSRSRTPRGRMRWRSSWVRRCSSCTTSARSRCARGRTRSRSRPRRAGRSASRATWWSIRWASTAT